MSGLKSMITVPCLVAGAMLALYFGGSYFLDRTLPFRGAGMTGREYLLAEFPWQGVEVSVATLESDPPDGDGHTTYRGFFRDYEYGNIYRFSVQVGCNRGGWYVQKAYCQHIPTEYLRDGLIDFKDK